MAVVTDDRKRIAPESLKTKRARDKLRKQWAEQDRFVTKEALAETVDKIHKWIAANAVYRIPLKNKEISLFDWNKNPAFPSSKMKQFAKKIELEMELIFPLQH